MASHPFVRPCEEGVPSTGQRGPRQLVRLFYCARMDCTACSIGASGQHLVRG
jgi:hypothetical protein